MTKQITDLSKVKNNKNHSGLDFLDTASNTLHQNNDISDLQPDDLQDFLFGLKSQVEGKEEYKSWKQDYDNVSQCYYQAVNDSLASAFQASMQSDLDVIFTKGMANKVREMVRVIANMLLKERPMFEPDPSSGSEELSEEDLITATRYLEHVWDRGGLRTELSVNVKSALRSNRGIMKVLWSNKAKDIVFKNVDAENFWFDISGAPEDSWWYCEKKTIPYIKLELSGLFTAAQLEKIRSQLKIKDSERKGIFDSSKTKINKTTEIHVYDFYLKQLIDGEEKFILHTYLEDLVFIRKTELDLDDCPYCFFIPERESNINEPSAMVDVANASVSSSYMNYKVLDWIKGVTDVTIVTDQQVQVDRTSTPGVRSIRTSSTDGGMSMQPVVAPQGMISQDVFFHLDKMERTTENNYGIHPNILQGVNGSTPSNGIVAQTLLANDIHNTSALSQEFSQFLSGIAYKVLYIASKTLNQHKIIRIEPTRGNSSSVKVAGAEATKDSPEGTGIQKIHSFPSIKVSVIPATAYTETAKQDKLIQLLQVFPEIANSIPRSKILETFASGSANLMMHEASREALRAEESQADPEVALAEAENQAMSAGTERVPQANENHAVHDRIHVIEEQFLLDQAQKANSQEESEQFNNKLRIVRSHRQQHSELAKGVSDRINNQAGQSPSIIGTEEESDEGVEGLIRGPE